MVYQPSKRRLHFVRGVILAFLLLGITLVITNENSFSTTARAGQEEDPPEDGIDAGTISSYVNDEWPFGQEYIVVVETTLDITVDGALNNRDMTNDENKVKFYIRCNWHNEDYGPEYEFYYNITVWRNNPEIVDNEPETQDEMGFTWAQEYEEHHDSEIFWPWGSDDGHWYLVTNWIEVDHTDQILKIVIKGWIEKDDDEKESNEGTEYICLKTPDTYLESDADNNNKMFNALFTVDGSGTTDYEILPWGEFAFPEASYIYMYWYCNDPEDQRDQPNGDPGVITFTDVEIAIVAPLLYKATLDITGHLDIGKQPDPGPFAANHGNVDYDYIGSYEFFQQTKGDVFDGTVPFDESVDTDEDNHGEEGDGFWETVRSETDTRWYRIYLTGTIASWELSGNREINSKEFTSDTMEGIVIAYRDGESIIDEDNPPPPT